MIDRIKQAGTSLRFWLLVLAGAITAANKVLNLIDETTLAQLLTILIGGAAADTVRPMGK